MGAYRTRLASDLGRDVMVEMWRSYGGGEWAKRCELALATTMAEPLGGKAKLRCSVAKGKKKARNGMVALEGSRRALRLQVENTSSGFRPATARGLGGQSGVDARRTRGHQVLNRPSTVAPEFFVSVTNEPTDSETCRQ